MRAVVPALAITALASGWVRAEPVLAARTGLGCASCHLNRTGGGGRTAYGAGYGGQTLPWMKLAQGHGLFDGAIGDRVRLGFDGRGGYYATFRETGPYLGEAKLTEADVYLGVELVKNRLSIYIDEHVAPGGASSREAFGLFSLDRAGFYVKGGKFFLPFGLRVQDDEAATRRATGFTFETADIGVETGFDNGAWSSSVSITNGTSGGAEADNGKQYCLIAARVFNLGRFGLSASINDLPAGAKSSRAGAFGTFRVGPIVVLAEADVMEDDDAATPKRRGGAGHVEVDALAHAGLTLRLFGGRLQPRPGRRHHARDAVGGRNRLDAASWIANPFDLPGPKRRRRPGLRGSTRLLLTVCFRCRGPESRMAPTAGITRTSQGTEKVREHLMTSLHLGRLRPGDRVASVRRLADITGLNRKTVHRAYGALAKEGFLAVRPGAGTFVAEHSHALRSQDTLTHAVNRCRAEAQTLGLSAPAFADFLHGVLNGGLHGLPVVIAECNREQIEMIGRDVRSGLGVEARPVLLDDLVADPARALSGAWGVVTTDCHRAEVESAARVVGLPVYRVALDPEFPQTILRWARSRDVVVAVGDDRFAQVFVRFLGQLGASPEVLARIHIVLPARLRHALRAAGDDAVVLVSALVHREIESKLPAHARHLAAHWRLAQGTLERLRAELAYDLAAKREGHA